MPNQIDTFSSRWDKLHFEHFQLQLQSWIVEDLIRGYAGFLWIFPPPCSRTYAIGSANSSPWFLQDFSSTLCHDPCPNLGLSMFGFGMLDGWFFRVQFRVHFFYFFFFKQFPGSWSRDLIRWFTTTWTGFLGITSELLSSVGRGWIRLNVTDGNWYHTSFAENGESFGFVLAPPAAVLEAVDGERLEVEAEAIVHRIRIHHARML